MTLQKSLKISTFIHLLPVILMGLSFPKGCGRGGEGNGHEEKQGQSAPEEKHEEIVEKPAPEEPAEITLIEETREEFELRVEKAIRKEIKECEPYFGGIGITYKNLKGEIGEVHKYYPAYDAGLKVGDVILSPKINGIKGEVGTPIDITYERNGVVNNVTIIRGRICTKEIKP